MKFKMKFTKYNKATAAVLSGAVIAVVGAFVVLTPEMYAALQTLLTAVAVALVPNGG